MGCIQLNEKLVARLKIGLTAKQFWNESRGILRNMLLLLSSSSSIFSLEENRMTIKLARDEFNEIQNLLAKHWTYQTLHKCITVAVVILPI